MELDQWELSDVNAVLEKARRTHPALYVSDDLVFDADNAMADWYKGFADQLKDVWYEPQDCDMNCKTDQAGLDKLMECDFIKYCQENEKFLRIRN